MSQRDLRVLGEAQSAVQINWDRQADSTIVRIGGEIDLLTAGELRACLLDSGLIGDSSRLIIDFTTVTFFGAAGLHVLDAVYDQCAHSGISLVVAAHPDVVHLIDCADVAYRHCVLTRSPIARGS
ncbi:STAS domain-containing protein [Nocardia brasiliensis]|uniref:STAS domain-containing protein n=1 Tax=Nocardia brasiliensis TaxID=37326 RepID=UPI00367135D6